MADRSFLPRSSVMQPIQQFRGAELFTAQCGDWYPVEPIAFHFPASGFIFSFNPSLGVITRETENFGPILTERADTIGKHKLFVGFSYQYFISIKRTGSI